MKLSQGKILSVSFIALMIAVSIVLMAGFCSAKDWRERSLWDRPESSSARAVNIPSDRRDTYNAAKENQAGNNEQSRHNRQ